MDKKSEKVRLDLLPWDALEEVARLLMYGAKDHDAFGWETLPDAVPEYRRAIGRHFSKLMQGQTVDVSGFRHEACIAADALIALARILREK